MTSWKKGINNIAFENLHPQRIIDMRNGIRCNIVDKLLRKQSRKEGGKVIAGYWVKWQGHSARDATWEPAANLPQHMVAKYESKRGRYYK